MTIDAHFNEISPEILEKLIENTQLVEAYFNWDMFFESHYWQEFCSSHASEEIQNLKKDIELIIDDAESAAYNYSYIQSRSIWHGISFILTGYCREYEIPFLVKENSEGDKLPFVNAVFGGTKIGDTGCGLGYDAIRYLTPEEVKQVAEALSKISAESFEARYELVFPPLTDDEIWEIAQEAASKVLSVETAEEKQNQVITTITERVFRRNDFSFDTDDYLEVLRYYTEAAEKGKAMLLYIR